MKHMTWKTTICHSKYKSMPYPMILTIFHFPLGAGDSASDTASTQGAATPANGQLSASESGDKGETDGGDTAGETESMDDQQASPKEENRKVDEPKKTEGEGEISIYFE